jgi:pilus assembly protein Flp/PilA
MQRALAATARVKAWCLAANDAAHRVMCAGDGQGLAEYALILALIAIVAIIALIFLGGQVKTILSTVGKSV